MALGAQFQSFLIEIIAPVLYPVQDLNRKTHEYASCVFLKVFPVGTTEMLAAVIRGLLLSGKHDLTRISDSGRILSSHKERFARASIVMSLHSWQRIAMVDLWREFQITDASARGSAYAGGGG